MSDKIIEDDKLKNYINRVFANYCEIIYNPNNLSNFPIHSKQMQYLMDQFNLIWSYDSELYKKIIGINEEHIKPISTGGNIYTKEHYENMKTLADYVAKNNITREKIFKILNKLNYDKISDITLPPGNIYIENAEDELITENFMLDFNNKFYNLRPILTQLKMRDNSLLDKIHKLVEDKKMGNIFWEYIINDLYGKNRKKLSDIKDFRKYLYINSDLMKFLYLYKNDNKIMGVEPVNT